MIYLDTSALIKRFVAERGSATVQDLVGRGERLATAKVAYVEVYAALGRIQREGRLSRAQYALITRQFELDWQAYVRVDLQDDVLRLARDLIGRHPLRGYDAIHLASALTLRNALGEEIVFAAADMQLLRAAAAERLRPLDVEHPDSLIGPPRDTIPDASVR